MSFVLNVGSTLHIKRDGATEEGESVQTCFVFWGAQGCLILHTDDWKDLSFGRQTCITCCVERA